MATYPATGITLLARAYKGTERIVVLYTRERGKVEAVVKGVGKPESKLAAAAEPLTLLRLQLAEGRGLDRVTQCEVVEPFYGLRNDLQRLALASYAAELVAATTEPGDADPVVFDALREALFALLSSREPELVVWGFVLRYLERHGTGPQLEGCVICGGELQGDVTAMVELGGCVCPRCAGNIHERGMELSAPARSALATLQRLPADRVGRLRLNDRARLQIRELLRRHVHCHLAVSLKSEAFLCKLGWPALENRPV